MFINFALFIYPGIYVYDEKGRVPTILHRRHKLDLCLGATCSGPVAGRSWLTLAPEITQAGSTVLSSPGPSSAFASVHFSTSSNSSSPPSPSFPTSPSSPTDLSDPSGLY